MKRFFSKVTGGWIAAIAIGVFSFATIGLTLPESKPTVADSFKGAVTQKSKISELGKLDPKKVKQFVIRLDKLLDSMEKPYTDPSDYDLVMWAYEILPYFAYEEMRNYPVVPNQIQLTAYMDGTEHNHILGRAQCVAPEDISPDPSDRPYSFDIEINARIGNPHSAWYADMSYLTTIVHELAHIQGACGSGDVDEHTAQIVMVEILSAMALGENREVLYPLINELRDWGMSYLLYDAINGNTGSPEKKTKYDEFRAEIYGDPFMVTRAEKSYRFWSAGRQNELARIVHTYSVTPLVYVFEAFTTGSTRLTIPEYDDGTSSGYGYNIKPYSGQREFKMDDFVALMKKLEVLVAQVNEETDNDPEGDR